MILQDGKEILTLPQPQLQPEAGGSPGTLVTGAVPLSSLAPGSYVLFVTAQDQAGKHAAGQWTDFDIADPPR